VPVPFIVLGVFKIDPEAEADLEYSIILGNINRHYHGKGVFLIILQKEKGEMQ